MAMNPMQRKANNYLLIGVLVTLLITGTIIAVLFIQLTNLKQQINKEETSVVTAYVLNKDVKSGETVTADMLSIKRVSSLVVSAKTLNLNLSGQDEDGNEIELISKIDISAGTILTTDMLIASDEQPTNDLRTQEYNMVNIPTQIQSGDYVDIRLRLSNGVDYIVASKKKVEIPDIDGIASNTTIKVNMNETEIMVMSNAIIEAYIDKGSLLYVATYVEPGLQKSMTPTYVPSGVVQNAINANPNIEQEAKNGLFSRYNANAATRTNIIDSALAQYAQDRVDNIEDGIKAEITRAKEERQLYLESLGGY